MKIKTTLAALLLAGLGCNLPTTGTKATGVKPPPSRLIGYFNPKTGEGVVVKDGKPIDGDELGRLLPDSEK